MTFGSFRKAADFIILSAGWRRRAIAFFAGAAGALALAPVDFFPAMLLPMMAAVWLIDGVAASGPAGAGVLFAEMRQAAGAGWWLGFGFFTAGLWWIGIAMLVDADQFAWAIPLAVLGLPAVLACFPAFGFALARALWSPRAARLLALAFGLGASEWARGFVATGFPWNEWGMALGGNLALAQIASLFGLYGLNFIAVVIFAAPALLIDARRAGRCGSPALVPALCLAALVCIGIYGALRLSHGHVENVAGARLRIMQPNIPEGPEFRPENKDKILDRYLSLSDRATSPQSTGIADVTHLIWPESAFPFILSRDASAMQRIQSFLGPKAILLTGAARMSVGEKGQRPTFYNSIEAIDQPRGIFAQYDKTHLVPFGEYLPLGGWFERMGLRNLVPVPGGFTPGASGKRMTIPGLPALSGLVCYEAVFPGEVTDHGLAVDRPGLLLNVSEDSWYGRSSGPYQHFAQARLRAIEEGLPLIRAANTGISAIVDPYGRVLSSLPLGAEGVLDGALPKALAATPFAKWPFAGPLSFLLLSLAGAMAGRLKSA